MSTSPIDLVRRAMTKARGRSIAEISERARQKIDAELEYRGLSSTVGEPGDDVFWHRVRRDVATSVGRDTHRLHDSLKTSPRTHFFAGLSDLAATARYLRETAPDQATGAIAAADRIVAGQFDLLGHPGLEFGSPIDWHLDPTTGTRSPRSHWSRIKYLDAAVVGDHKVVWEINRHQHFMTLGRAYVLTGDERYATTFVGHVASWMDENPPSVGVNWASSLEVAYRLIAWLWAFELFRDSPHFTAAVRMRMLKHLYSHATHVERFLSTYFSPNTHLTGEALGLWYAGNMLSLFVDADRWSRTAWSILSTQIERQVHPDGVYFEQATYYHRYTVDIFTHALLLARASQQQVPPVMLQRLDALVNHLADVMRPDGSIPLIGDDDGGRLVALEERQCDDARAAIATAAVLFERPKFAGVAASVPQETVWLLGPNGGSALRKLNGAALTEGSRAYTEGGFVVFRDGWSKDANHAVIDFGPHGTANCGHAHADALSIDLTSEGAPLFVDPGTFSYTGSLGDRDYFRSSRSHNTLTIDGESSSEMAGPFSWMTKTDSQMDEWWSTESFDYFSGSHTGFERFGAGAIHRRRVFFVKQGYWVIWDSAELPRDGAVVVHFHAAPGTRVDPVDHQRALLARAHDGKQLRNVIATFGTSRAMSWDEDWVSPCYGQRVKAPACQISSHGAGRHDFVSVIAATTHVPDLQISELLMQNGYGIVIAQSDCVDIVTFRTDGTLSGEDISTDADLTWIRRSAGDEGPRAIAMCGGKTVRVGDIALTRASVGRATARRSVNGWASDDGDVSTSARPNASDATATGAR